MEQLCVVDWIAVGTMLVGIGTLILGLSALVTIFVQWGYRKQAEELKQTVKARDAALAESERLRAKAQDASDSYEEISGLLMASIYGHFNEWFASEEGIVFDYPNDKEKITEIISKRVKLEPSLVAEMLANLEEDGFIKG